MRLFFIYADLVRLTHLIMNRVVITHLNNESCRNYKDELEIKRR